MKKVILAMLFICMGILLVGCGKKQGQQQGEVWDYRPMIYVQDRLYGDDGGGVNKLPEDAELIGKIETQVSQNEPMVKENFTANTDLEGCEVYGNGVNKESIYVEYKSINAKVKYGSYERLDGPFEASTDEIGANEEGLENTME